MPLTRALFIDAAERASVRHVEISEPDADHVLLRVHHVGICGSDLHYYFDGANGAFTLREPLIPGHEMSGTVEIDPSGEYASGTPVTVHPARFGTEDPRFRDSPQLWPQGSYLGSASTWPHSQGALSEHLLVHRTMIRPLPDALPLRRAALAEPLAVALHAVAQAQAQAHSAGARIEGSRILVTGSGPVGLLAIAAAAAAGAAEITATDVLPGPLTRAREQGAEHTLDVRRDELPESHYDVVLECSGAIASVGSALRSARPAGTVVQVGMVPAAPRPVDLSPLISKEVRLIGAFRFSQEIDAAIDLLAARPEIESVITHELPPEDPRALFAAARDAESSGKVITAPWTPSDETRRQ